MKILKGSMDVLIGVVELCVRAVITPLIFLCWASGMRATIGVGNYGEAHNFREFRILVGKTIKSKFCQTRF